MDKFLQKPIHFNQPNPHRLLSAEWKGEGKVNTLTSAQPLWSLKFGIVAVAVLAFWPYLDKSGAGEDHPDLIWLIYHTRNVLVTYKAN